MLPLIDIARRAQGELLGRLGLDPRESPYRVVASGAGWRLRDYGGSPDAPALLIVAAPIKRPYIWDLSPSTSVVRHCRALGLQVRLVEWEEPTPGAGAAGLADYAGRALGEAVTAATCTGDRHRPILVGHSLGGTLAAIFAALEPERVGGIVLLGAPLCFHAGVSRFRDALVRIAPAKVPTAVVPGTLLSQLAVLAAPEAFVWARLLDAVASSADPRAWETHLRVERWALDEMPLAGPLVEEILTDLFREDRLGRGTLELAGRTVGPAAIRTPMLAVACSADEVAPPASVLPFAAALPAGLATVLTHPGEVGVGLQHLAILIGRRTRARVWPEILAWIRARH